MSFVQRFNCNFYISHICLKVHLDTGDNPHEYVIDLTYSIAISEDCPSNRTVGITLNQTIEVNVVGKYTSIEVDN